MGKSIDELNFWKDRIDTAQKEHYSVYVCGEQMWKDINTIHNEIFDKEIKPTDKVLDAGCGYGRWSEKFDNYTGIDFSPDFIAKAQSKYPQKTFIQADLKDLPFKDKEFDVAFCVSIKKMICDNLGENEWNKMEIELKRIAYKVLVMEYEDPKPYQTL